MSKFFGTMLLIAVSLMQARTSIGDEMPLAINSPADVWQGFDPAALPLDVQSIKAWEDQGCRFEKLRFTSEQADGTPVRVFAIQGAPLEGKSLPGILHIHGGGQTASLEWVRFWAERGYVAATFDFCGPWADRTEVTEWGPLKHCNMAQSQGGFQVDPNVRASSWYHWTVASRRALTLLAKHPQVDPERLGIFGISMGGTLCWMVAGSDPRVKTAVPIYGCGYNHDQSKVRWGFPELTPQLALFQRAMSSEAHAAYVSCPILFLNATNDFHGWLDHGYDALRATTGPTWQAFTPRHNHHIAPPQGANLPAWMAFQLNSGTTFPPSPTIDVKIASEGQTTATVAAPGDLADRVDVFYSLGDKPPPNRFWRRIEAKWADQTWSATLPLADTWQPVFAFANVSFSRGVCLSTNLSQIVPGQLGKARATLPAGASLDPKQVAEGWFFATAYTDPQVSKQYLKVEWTEDHRLVTALNPEIFGGTMHVNVASHVLGDPQFAGQPGQSLALDCTGGFDDDGLTVTLTESEWTPRGKSYSTKIARAELTPGWKTIELPLARFQTAEGIAPESWRRLDKIQLQGKTAKEAPFRISNLRWVETTRESPAATP